MVWKREKKLKMEGIKAGRKGVGGRGRGRWRGTKAVCITDSRLDCDKENAKWISHLKSDCGVKTRGLLGLKGLILFR